MDRRADKPWQTLAICAALAAITFAVFWQTIDFQFLNYDDTIYVTENPVVQQGLTGKGLAWAFTYGKIGHWHPLTWLSHMLDCQFYGLNPGGPHMTNVVLHSLAAALLLLALKELTGNLWRSAFVAAVFAIHPLRVESVAWIAERKDVLSGVFFMLTLWAYARYARRPSTDRYIVVTVAYALGLLSKNTLVTLPFVLLLLDWWPLERVKAVGETKLIKEKIPLFALAAASCVATFLVPEKMADYSLVPFGERLANAAISYTIYLRELFVPIHLEIPCLYPHDGFPAWEIAAALIVLTAISVAVWRSRIKQPYLLVGWLWFLGVLVPMIGLVQIADYARADRYTYLSEIGVVLAVTWAVSDWSLQWKHRREILSSAMIAVVGVLMICAGKQTAYWKDSATLWTHVLAVDNQNDVAHSNLGLVLLQQGQVDDATAHFQKALDLNPNNGEAHNNLGTILYEKGDYGGAIVQYRDVLDKNPENPQAWFNLGNALQREGNNDEAIADYQNALQQDPDYAKAHTSLGNSLRQIGKVDEALAEYQRALQLDPTSPTAEANIGVILMGKGQMDEAADHFQKAIKLAQASGRQDMVDQLNADLQRCHATVSAPK
jgi:tetratricopeptide (TPR) repeat protein